MGIRSFLAFSLPAEIRSVVEQAHEALKDASRDVKWVRPASIHLTVVFLGSVDEEAIPDLSRAARGVCAEFGPFRLAVRGAGFFPNPRRPRVIWLGLEGDVERMGMLRDALQEALAPFGIEPERRPFRPHLTLGRFRKGGFMDDRLAAAMEGWTEATSPDCLLDELVLFKSDLRRGGAVYTALDRFPFPGER
ncbi:MAG: RNA 2',3'-cyclic phosphodiesterase [Deltaproteobacteria bacterium]|nr:RNA 2',3'-cyclic phosphodiesterase [Deltaproteobacteria bacterium]